MTSSSFENSSLGGYVFLETRPGVPADPPQVIRRYLVTESIRLILLFGTGLTFNTCPDMDIYWIQVGRTGQTHVLQPESVRPQVLGQVLLRLL